MSSDSPIFPPKSKPLTAGTLSYHLRALRIMAGMGKLLNKKSVYTCYLFTFFNVYFFFFFKKGNGLPFPFYPSYFIFLLFSLPSLHFSSQNVGSVLAVPYTLFEICIHSIIVMIGRKVFHQLCCTFRLNQMKGICEELNQIEPNERYI